MGATGTKIARALGGFAEGFHGRGPEYLQQIDDKRKQALLDDAFTVQQQLQQGNVPAARQTLLNRLQAIEQLGGDPRDTDSILLDIERGNVDKALQRVTTVVDFGISSGALKAPARGQKQVVDGQLVDLTTGTATPIKGYNPNTQAAQDRGAALALREREFGLKETIEARQQNKLSSGLEKVLLEGQQASIDRQGDAINFRTMAQEFETRSDELYGGVAMTVNEAFKAVLGSQDDVTELRRKINAIRVAEGIGQLPPGVASDKDIELVMSGQIRENAGPEQVAQYLRGASKAAQYAAGYNQLKVDYINKTRKGAGLNQVWRRSHESPVLGRKVTTAEIYRTAIDSGLAIDDVLQQLGIKAELF